MTMNTHTSLRTFTVLPPLPFTALVSAPRPSKLFTPLNASVVPVEAEAEAEVVLVVEVVLISLHARERQKEMFVSLEHNREQKWCERTDAWMDAHLVPSPSTRSMAANAVSTTQLSCRASWTLWEPTLMYPKPVAVKGRRS